VPTSFDVGGRAPDTWTAREVHHRVGGTENFGDKRGSPCEIGHDLAPGRRRNGGAPVDAHNIVARRGERLHKVGSDKPSRTGYDDRHQCVLLDPVAPGHPQPPSLR
jgi:hypothetical protein